MGPGPSGDLPQVYQVSNLESMNDRHTGVYFKKLNTLKNKGKYFTHTNDEKF